MASESSDSARAALIKTRRGSWVDKSLLPAARQESLDVLRKAARKAVGEDTYLPEWISDEVESAEVDLELLSSERLSWRYASVERKLDEEVWAAIDELRAQGAFEGLDYQERLDLEDAVEERIRSERESQIALEIEEARNKELPKSNPTLSTEKDMLKSTLGRVDFGKGRRRSASWFRLDGLPSAAGTWQGLGGQEAERERHRGRR